MRKSMNQVKVKICGLARKADMAIANMYQPDYVGFVFAKSRRQVSQEEARELRKVLDPKIQVVGVFVDESVEVMASYLDEGIIDVVQLHGKETKETVENLRALTENPIIKAVSVTTIDDVLEWENSSVDFLLLDHGKGGTGQTFDWSILNQLQSLSFSKPYFIAGGLDGSKVKSVLVYQPYGVDVSSGVETDGIKDEWKIKEFIEHAKL